MDEKRYYTTVSGDMWDSIAYAFYGDVKYIGLLMDSNPHLLDISVFSDGHSGLYPGVAGRKRRRPSRMESVSHASATVLWFP